MILSYLFWNTLTINLYKISKLINVWMIYNNNMQYSDYYCHYLLKKFQFDRYTVNSLGYFLH